jgi:hypothetical protein
VTLLGVQPCVLLAERPDHASCSPRERGDGARSRDAETCFGLPFWLATRAFRPRRRPAEPSGGCGRRAPDQEPPSALLGTRRADPSAPSAALAGAAVRRPDRV